jgi:hypothetical protein
LNKRIFTPRLQANLGTFIEVLKIEVVVTNSSDWLEYSPDLAHQVESQVKRKIFFRLFGFFASPLCHQG